MKKKLFLFLIVFCLLNSSVLFVLAQTNPNNVLLVENNNFEAVVVKEHFITKKEIKEHIDKKILEYQKTTEKQLDESFKEVNGIIDGKINKFLFKLVICIFGVMVFGGSCWFFIRTKLDLRFKKIQDLQNLSSNNNFPSVKGGVHTFSGDNPMIHSNSGEVEDLQSFKDDLVREANSLKQ